MIKLAGMAFAIASLRELRLFYGLWPTPLLVLLVYSVVGPIIDLFKLPLDVSALNTFFGPLLMWILMLATYNLAVRGGRGRIVLALVLSSLLFAVFQVFELGGVGMQVAEEVHNGETADRVWMLHADPNFGSCFMALSILAGVMYLLNLVPVRAFYRILAVPVVAVGVYGIIKTSSRTGLAALILGLLAIVLTARTWNRRIKTFLFVALVLCGITALVFASSLFSARLNDSLTTGDTADRITIWGQSVLLFLHSPFYGYGAQSYSFPLGERAGHPGIATHNVFLSAALGSGLIGLFSLMFVYIRAFASIFANRTQGRNRIVFVWFVMTFTAALSLNMEYAKWYWIILALALAAGKDRHQRGPAIRSPPGLNLQSALFNKSRPDGGECLPIEPR